MTKQQKEKFLNIACLLSPENLNGDGEFPKSYVNQRFKQLRKQWAQLEKEVGRQVSEQELYPTL